MMPASTPARRTLAERLPRLALPSSMSGLVPTELSLDSRDIGRGSLFIALPGERGHGISHLAQAAASGAIGVLAAPGGDWDEARLQAAAGSLPIAVVAGLEKSVGELAADFYGRPGERLRICGVTGTNGKTSVSWLLAQTWNRLGDGATAALLGTLGYGRPGALRATRHTTPDPVRLQAILAELVDAGRAELVMEVSSHALAQGRVDALSFDTAVLTNFSRDHLDYHGDMASYAAAKSMLFERPELRHLVLNADDEFGQRLLARFGADERVLAYGERARAAGAANWLSPNDVEVGLAGLRIRFDSHAGSAELEAPLVGRFNVSNLLAVVGVLLRHGHAPAGIATAVSGVRPPPGRMQRIADPERLVVVDYAHTPDALEKALGAIREHTARRVLCLFGCGGERDQGKRAEMGAVAERLADGVFVTDDNPRRENGNLIIRQILAGMDKAETAVVERDRRAAIRAAVAELQPGDSLLIAGKGHEQVQQIGDLAMPFDDAGEARAALVRSPSRSQPEGGA